MDNSGRRNIKLTIAYDGTDFSGWQTQAGTRTVQGELERALAVIHKHPVPLAGAGRTDAGVHAAGQAANFYTDIASIPAERFVPALNGLLPSDVRVLSACQAPPEFHARFDALMRRYRYFLLCGRIALPHENRFALNLRHIPDIRLLSAYCRLLRGEIDCSLFASPADAVFTRGSGSRSRFIEHCGFSVQGEHLVFDISANAFFWKMVRSITGTLLYYEERRLPPSEFAAILKKGIHAEAGPTAPARGLFLWRVDYKADY
ncbi:MAG: tRNA pseudouridine(38-40) synthase TruA [Spirochaetaceae bacterium]|jgi:tRNA pseudouridine38-40 synthase|nr:tRNA pseudouridine(38-40) synthase TruA [Spirochaetaceae bacterium]